MQRLARSVAGRVRSARAHPALHPSALAERVADWRGGHVADATHAPHRDEALAWLDRAQQHGAGGFARGYSLVRDPYFGWTGWQPAYPETTGYIIPTLLAASRWLNRPALES